MLREQETHQEMKHRNPNVTSIYFVTPLAFYAADRGVTMGRSPQYFARRSKWLMYKMPKNIAESFNPLNRAHQRYRQQTTDGLSTKEQRPERNVVTFG